MNKHLSFFIFLFFLILGHQNASYADAASVLGSGGSNNGGQSIQAEEFSGSATYSITLPVPPARGGIEPQLILNYNSYRKNPNSWVGYGWELDLGSIERMPEKCDGDFENCNTVNYYEGKEFQVKFSGQSELLTLRNENVDVADYGLSLASGETADLYGAKIESAFNLYFHILDKSDSNDVKDNGWIIIDKSGRTYTYGVSDYARESTTRCEVNTDPDTCTEHEWVSRWSLEEVTDPNGNTLEISYGASRFPSSISYQDIEIEFDKDQYSITEGDYYSYFPTFRQGFLNDNKMGWFLDEMTIYQNGTRIQKIDFDIERDASTHFAYLKGITQYGSTDSESLPETTFDYYGQDDLAWDSSGSNWMASTSNLEGTSDGTIGFYTQFIDMNGDALPDLVTSYDDSDKMYVYYNNGTDFEYIDGRSEWDEPWEDECLPEGKDVWAGCVGKLNSYWAWDGTNHQRGFLMDMNGDALPDRVIVGAIHSSGSESYADLYVAYNNGLNGWSTTSVWRDPYMGQWPGTADADKWFMDMNGDGLIDRVISGQCNDECKNDDDYKDGGFIVYYNNGAGFNDTPVYWKDPIAGGSISGEGRFSSSTDDKVFLAIKDINGDGLPDRIWKATNHVDGVEVGKGFGVSLNRNGLEWAQPDTIDGFLIINGYDILGMNDPMEDEDNRGYISSDTFDLIDMNGDGYLDRIEGDTDDSLFRIYYYQGMENFAGYGDYSAAYEFDDPISDSGESWKGSGYVTKGEKDDDQNPRYHTLIIDINGDGYPDRVSLSPRDEDTTPKYYKIYTMKVNDVEFSDIDSGSFTQPVGSLKHIIDGKGMETAIEYLASSYQRRWDSKATPNHWFLPFNLFTAHNVYSLDYTMPDSDSSVEAARWPGMRWTTYDYWGGNFFVRHAVKTSSSDEEDDSLTSPYFAQFNGFQTVSKKVYKADGETWDPITTTTLYHQAKGDVDTVDDESVFDTSAFGHFALSGQMASTTIATDSQTLVLTENTWEINEDSASDHYNCSGDYCLPQLTTSTKTVTEESDSHSRKSKVTYDYDDKTGNIISETYYDKNDDVLLKKTTTYYSSADFDTELQMRDRPKTQYQSGPDGTVYRSKKFGYDSRGNPTSESFLRSGSSDFVSITRTFNSNGTLETLTDIDGVTKTIGYDSDNLFPETEQITLPTGATITTTRSFHRLSGEMDSEIDNTSAGKSIDYDDFGRPTTHYLISSTGSLDTDKEYDYDYSTHTVEDWGSITLLKTSVYVPRSDYSDTLTNPMQISYADASGFVLQQCNYTERRNYRLVQSRQYNGGRTSYQTEPVFTDNCTFISSIPSSVRTYLTQKDYQGRPVYIEPPAGDTTAPTETMTLAYSTNSDGQMVKTSTMGSGIKRTETFDYNERLITITDHNGSTLNYDYNPVGDIETVTANSTTLMKIDYDLLGRKNSMTDADLGTWNYSYDDYGNLDKQTDNAGQVIDNDYDSIGRLSTRTIYNSSGSKEKYEKYYYDSGDSTHDVTNGELYKVEEYNSSDTLLRSTSYGYDTDYRRVAKITRYIPAIGELEQTVSKDFRGELNSVSYPGGESLYYDYDRIGNIEKVCNVSDCNSTTGEVYYSIDASSGYNVFGALLKESFGNGVSNEYTYYDNSHRLYEKKISKGTSTYSQRTYEYDSNMNVTAVKDSLSQKGSAALSLVEYDKLHRMTSYQYASDSSAKTLDYDSMGNITKNSVYSSSNYEYTSSRPHAVTKIGTESFAYDNNGNMTSDAQRTMTYNSQNQLTKVTMKNGATASYDYDYTGSRVEKTSQREDYDHVTHTATTYYLGDVMEIKDNELIFNIAVKNERIATKNLGDITELLAAGTMRNSGITPNINNISYLMPWFLILFGFVTIASFRPVRVVMPGLTRHPGWISILSQLIKLYSSYTQSLNESLKLLPHRFASKLLTLILIFISLTQVPLIALAGDTGNTATTQSDENYFYYYHGDPLGSAHVITEGNSAGGKHMGIFYNRGTLLQRIEYSPFGQETYVLNPNLKLDPRFTDQSYDVETGLYYFKARFYNPAIGQFIQPDTLVPEAKDLQAYNRYSYVMNNPLKYTDPSGHGFWSWFKKLAGIFIGALIGTFLTVITAGALGPIMAAALGGLIGGAIGGGITGGFKGALMGALFGGLGGAVFGAAGQGLAALGVSKIGSMAIFGVIGAGLSYATGGWKGLLYFGVGMLGGALGNKLGKTALANFNDNKGSQGNGEDFTEDDFKEAIEKIKSANVTDTKLAQLRNKVVLKLEKLLAAGRILNKEIPGRVNGKYIPILDKILIDPTDTYITDLANTLFHEGLHANNFLMSHLKVYQFEYDLSVLMGYPAYGQRPTKEWLRIHLSK